MADLYTSYYADHYPISDSVTIGSPVTGPVSVAGGTAYEAAAVAPLVMTILTTVSPPAIDTATSATPTAIDSTASIPQPGVTAFCQVAPSSVSGAAAITTPQISTGNTVNCSSVDGFTAIPVPNIAAGGSVNVNAVAVDSPIYINAVFVAQDITWEGTDFDFSEVPPEADIQSVVVTVRHYESAVADFDSLDGQVYVSGSPVGTADAFTLSASAQLDQVIVTSGVSVPDLADLEIRVTGHAIKAAATLYIDWAHADITVSTLDAGAEPSSVDCAVTIPGPVVQAGNGVLGFTISNVVEIPLPDTYVIPNDAWPGSPNRLVMPVQIPFPIINGIGGHVALPTVTVEAGFNSTGQTIAWEDISGYVRSFGISRKGSRLQGPLYQYNAGTATILLKNDDGRFDPDNLAGPYVSSYVKQTVTVALSGRGVWKCPDDIYDPTQSWDFATGLSEWQTTGVSNCSVEWNTINDHNGPGGSMDLIADAAGGYMLALSAHDGGADVIAYGLRVSPGDQVYLSGWCKSSTVSRSMQMGISGYADQGDGTTSWHANSQLSGVTTNTSGWTQCSGYVYVPSGVDYVIAMARINSPGSAGETHHFDDITMTAASGKTIKVECIGGGGGGAGGAGGGGGGGEYAKETALAVTSGEYYAYSVGAGGESHTAQQDGDDGEDSQFIGDSDSVVAHGGSGGNWHGNGGSGGTGSSNYTHHNGGSGGNYYSTYGGGGGGSSAGITSSGNSGGSATSTYGGAGGAAPAGGGPGGDGGYYSVGYNPDSSPGGGGGGGGQDSAVLTGGKGYNGSIKVTYEITVATGPESQVRAMIPIRITADWAGTGYDLFYGYADSWQDTGINNPNYAEVELTATDGFKILSGIVLPESPTPVGEGEDAGARVNRILDAANWPPSARSINTGDSDLQATSFGSDVMSLLHTTVDSEIGELYINGAGNIVFRHRQGILEDERSTTPQAVFGDSIGSYRYIPSSTWLPELPYAELTRSDDDTQLANDIQAQIVGGAVQEVRNAASEAKYIFPHSYSRTDLILQSDAAALAWAQWVLAISLEADQRFDEIKILPRRDTTHLYPQVLEREIGDRIRVCRRPPRPADSGTTNTWTFESGTQNWSISTGGSLSQSSTEHHGGSYSLRMASSAAQWEEAKSPAPGIYAIAGGSQGRCSVWVRSPTSGLQVETHIAWYEDSTYKTETKSQTTYLSPNSWTELAVDESEPCSAGNPMSGVLHVYCLFTGSGQYLYIDDASLTVYNAAVIEKDCFIRGIEHSVDYSSHSWNTTWSLQSSDKYGGASLESDIYPAFFTLGTSAGILGVNGLSF